MKTVTINDNYKEKYGFSDSETVVFKTKKGLNEEVIKQISERKNEPEWMLELRLKAFKIFKEKVMPTWGADLSKIDFENITYYVDPSEVRTQNWDDLPDDIRKTFDKLGIPEAEKKFLGGAGGQYDSEVLYHKLREDLVKKGVVFMSTDEGLQKYPELFKRWFGKIIPANDNKFAALNTAVWSGGSFIYIPKGVKVEVPLQAYFRINAKESGQFERTLIIADEEAEVNYVEGCSSPVYSKDSLHTAVVELVALKGAKIRYTTIQNWSNNVYNLVTKRAHAYEGAYVEWLDSNVGAFITMKYPSVYLVGRNSKANILSVAFANSGQHQDAGAKVLHLAPNTSSTILSKSISKGSGKTTFRGLIHVSKGSRGSKSHMRCDAILLNKESKSDTIPSLQINEEDVNVGHEATVGKIGEEQLFYLMSRGLTEQEAITLIINGFFKQFVKELPLEYAIEFNKLIELVMNENG